MYDSGMLINQMLSNLEYIFMNFLPKIFTQPCEQLNTFVQFAINGPWWTKVIVFSGVLAAIKIISYNITNFTAAIIQLIMLLIGLIFTYQLGVIIFI